MRNENAQRSKHAVKANNGFWHSFYFTAGWYPDTIEITKFDHRVTKNALSIRRRADEAFKVVPICSRLMVVRRDSISTTLGSQVK